MALVCLVFVVIGFARGWLVMGPGWGATYVVFAIVVLAARVSVFGPSRKPGSPASAASEETSDGLVMSAHPVLVAAGHLRDGIVIVGSDIRVLYANAKAAKLLGISEKSLLLEGSQASSELRYLLGQVVRHKAELHRDIVIDGDGAESAVARPVVRVKAYALESGQVAAIAILEDRTTESAVEEYHRESVSDIAHDLRAPLTAIQGCAEALLDSDNHASELGQCHLRLVLDGCREMSLLIGDILDVSLMAAGRFTIDFQKVELNRIVDSVARLFDKPLADQQISLAIELDSNVSEVLGDSRRIQQSLTNLVANAINYSPAGSAIRIEGRVERDFVKISVVDNGPGVPDEHLSRIWERYFRSRQRNKATVGTGLGLAIVKRITELHGGRVGVESQAGCGSVFWFTIPRSR